MPVDPQLQAMLDALQAIGWPRLGSVTAAELRAIPRPRPPVVTEVRLVSDGVLPGPAGDIPIRVYRPIEQPRGVIVYYHGGGWTIGDLDTADAALRLTANQTGCTVVSVDYRLAPEHPFPAAVDDAMAAVSWVAGKLADFDAPGAPLMVMGDSAGANLSAVVCLLARDAGGPEIALQVLVYPGTEGDVDAPSMHAFEPPFLNRQDIIWFYDQYAPPEQRRDARLAPAKAASHANLPPAILVTAEYDLLTAEGEAYARQLEQAGVAVDRLHYEGAIHGFFTMAPHLGIGRKAIDDVSREIAARFSRG
jgi:acetyl esterase